MEDAGLEFLQDTVDRFLVQEEFVDSLEHPDPVPLALLTPDEVNPAGQEARNVASGCGSKLTVVALVGRAAATDGSGRYHPLRPRNLLTGPKRYYLVSSEITSLQEKRSDLGVKPKNQKVRPG
ncbi:uncharacterized protein LOC119297499 [Triticum dicoccoides]|uniref:uncharacterized protein LOC119297499 n=1 Tax=Triticum dicoccoides TaxID=85692 RepID=UPI000E7C2665|nr:uncharacterized protein LOC119297499 [Triticum dicoccoides]